VNSRTIACVEWGNYLGRGEEYVAKLRAMVARHTRCEYEFVVLRPTGLIGWWNKIELFRPGALTGRILYLDLDTVVVGSLDPLFESKGILHLANWGWTKNDYGSGVMVWDAGEHEEVYSLYDKDVPSRFRGDQDWMTHLGGWEALPPALCKSYRYHSKASPPEGASVVCFHGTPKPHEIASGWVPEAWR
jgi:hypothetical protein